VSYLNTNLIFLIKTLKLNEVLHKFDRKILTPNIPLTSIISNQQNKIKLTQTFLKKSITMLKFTKLMKSKNRNNLYFFINRFILGFLEGFFKKKILFNLKKGSNKIILRQISFRKFSLKYFKKNLKINKQVLGVLYYSLLLKDASIFVNFLKPILEKINIKLHKKLFLGLRKLIKDFFKPIFNFLGVLGVFFNISGKIGVSGSAKKRRYYFYFGKHSITTRKLKIDLKFTPV
jgi:hypothetical protein